MFWTSSDCVCIQHTEVIHSENASKTGFRIGEIGGSTNAHKFLLQNIHETHSYIQFIRKICFSFCYVTKSISPSYHVFQVFFWFCPDFCFPSILGENIIVETWCSLCGWTEALQCQASKVF